MDAQEREVIDGIFNRLREAESHPRDPEAERYIAELTQRQPYATYALAQSFYVQDMAVQQLTNEKQQLEQRVAQLEQELRAAREQAAQAQPQTQPQPQQPASGGFLSGLFGGRSSVPSAGAPRGPAGAFARSAPPQGNPGGPFAGNPGVGGPAGGPPPGGPWSRGPMQPGMGQPAGPMGQPAGPWGGAQAPAGGGFLRSALTTAAGVAGGALLFDAVKGMMGGSSAANATPLNKDAPAADAAPKDDAAAKPEANDATAQPAADQGADPSQNDATYQDAGYQDNGWDNSQGWDDNGGWDDGGGDDGWL